MKKEFLDVDIGSGMTEHGIVTTEHGIKKKRVGRPCKGSGTTVDGVVTTEHGIEKNRVGRPCKGQKGVPRGTRATNKWLQLVAKVKADNPGITYKEALQAASHIRAEHGYDQALGAGFSLKGLVSGIGKAAKKVGALVKKAAPHVKKAVQVAAPHVGKFASKALEHAQPHLIKAGEEALERGFSKVSGMPHENKPFSKIALEGAVDVGRKVAHEGLSMAAKELSKKQPQLTTAIKGVEKSAHQHIEAVKDRGERGFHEMFGEGSGAAGGEIDKYVDACCKHCARHEPSGGFAAAAAIPIIAALAPTVVPAAASLIEKLFGLGRQQHGNGFIPFLMGALSNLIGKGTPGDYSFNRLGGNIKNKNNSSIHKSIMGGMQQGGNPVQKSDAPIDNVWATHAQLWWFTPEPGLMGRTELPANQFFLRGRDVNSEIWEQANDVDGYINSAPTYEDGVTTAAPMGAAYSKAAMSGMPTDSTIGSTLSDIKSEGSGAGRSGGFVYAPGMSIERLASAQHKYGMGSNSCNSKLGAGGAFSIAGKGGDVTRMGIPGRGVIPPESTITGTPIGISQRGRGTLIKGANTATWNH